MLAFWRKNETVRLFVCLVGWIIAIILGGLYIRAVWNVANYKKLIAAAEASNRQLEREITELQRLNREATAELAKARAESKEIADITNRLAKKINGGRDDLRTIDETNKRLTELLDFLERR